MFLGWTNVPYLVLLIVVDVDLSSGQSLSAVEGYGPNDPASLELPVWAEEHKEIGNYTRASGIPIYDILNMMTAGKYGPLVMQDASFLGELQHFDRERIPERVVHAKGAGAFGYFLNTNDLSEYTQAHVLTQVGKRTPVVVRFSRIGGNIGDPDTVRDGRGFAIKFYTDQGNWDMVGLNLPNFWIRDSMRFPSLIHVNKRNPQTGLTDPTAFWDFLTLLPESLTMILNVFSDLGIPASFRTMNGHSVNVFSFTRPDGKRTFVKFNLASNQGIVNLTPSEAVQLAGIDGDYHRRDLYNNIAKGNFPSWNMSAQLLTPENAEKMPWNPFDVTKIWLPQYTTTVPMGILVLNQNPMNYFAQVEQVGFDPDRLVPGIEPTVDKILQGRLFSYTDTLMYRLGVNHELLPVNRPIDTVANRERDGRGRSDANQGGSPNYFPNSFHGPQGNVRYRRIPYPVEGLVQSYNSTGDDNYSVPKLLWQSLSEQERNNIAANIVQTLSQTPRFIQERAVNNFYTVSPEWGSRVAALLHLADYTPQQASESNSSQGGRARAVGRKICGKASERVVQIHEGLPQAIEWAEADTEKCIEELKEEHVGIQEVPLHGRSLETIAKNLAILGRQSTHSGGPMLPRVVLIGTRGSFKRTIACNMAQEMGVVHINMEELIDQALQRDNELSRELRELSSRNIRLYGKLIVAVLEDRLLDYDCLNKGWVLTGFPRDHKDFAVLDLFDTPPNRVIFITNNSLEALERVSNRRINIYTGEYRHKDDVAEIEDVVAREQFVIHPDDDFMRVLKEQKEFNENVQGMLAYCKGNCIVVDGTGGLDSVMQRVFTATLQASPPGDLRTASVDQVLAKDGPDAEGASRSRVKPEKSILALPGRSKSNLRVAFDAESHVGGDKAAASPSQSTIKSESKLKSASSKGFGSKTGSEVQVCVETSISGLKPVPKPPVLLKKSADLPPYESCTSIFPGEIQMEWGRVRSKLKSYMSLPPINTKK